MTHRAELHLARKQLKGCINLHNMPSKFWVDVCGYKTFLAWRLNDAGHTALCAQKLPWILLYRPSAFHPSVTGADWAQQLKEKRNSKPSYPACLDNAGHWCRCGRQTHRWSSWECPCAGCGSAGCSSCSSARRLGCSRNGSQSSWCPSSCEKPSWSSAGVSTSLPKALKENELAGDEH